MADDYQFQVLQSRPYIFSLSGVNLPADTQPTLIDTSGNPIPLLPQGNGSLYLVSLDPGEYVVQVGSWGADQAADVTYQLGITLGPSQENPTPLTVRPAPAFRLLVASAPAPTPPPFTPPAGNPSPPPANPPPIDSAGPPTTPIMPPVNAPITVVVNPPPSPVPAPPPSLNLPAPGPSNPPAPPIVGPSPADVPVVGPAVAPPMISGTPTAPGPTRLVLPPPTGSILNSQAVPIAVRDTPTDFRFLGSTLSDGAAGRSDVPTFTNGVIAGFTREVADEGHFFLTIPANALAGLSAAPVGGFRSATTPEPPATQQPQSPRTDSPPPTDRHTRIPPELLRSWEKLCRQYLDDFFTRTFSSWNLADWLKQLQAVMPAEEAAPTDPESTPPDGPEAALPSRHPAWTWASGLILVGLMTPRDPRERLRPQPCVGRRETSA